MSITLGIDFGTTKSVVGGWIDNKPFIIPCKNGQLSIPSEILVQGTANNQEIFVGWDAKNKNKYSVESFLVHSIKRSAGKSNYSKEKWWYVYPQYTISFILAELKCMAEDFFKQDISDAVIAIPSHFDLNQRRAILEAASIAGINVIRLLNEATATAITYSTQNNKEEVILVVDIGGGTTDISVVEISKDVYDVLYIDGDTNIGGIDYNNILYDWFLAQLFHSYAITESEISKPIEVIIKDEIEMIKIELAENYSSEIYLPWLSINGKFLDKKFKITQNEFKEISKKLTTEIVNILKRTTANLKLPIDSYVLTGNASKTFGIKEMIKEELNIEYSNWGLRTETSVVKGAIIQSRILQRNSNKLIIDCIQDNYGIELTGGVIEIFLSKNETIPVTKIKEFTTTEDSQTGINLKVYKGDNPVASKNKFLGYVELSNLPLSPKGSLKIIVQFDVDVNMNISISAQIKDNEKIKVKTKLESEYGLPNDLLKDMKKKIEIWKSKRKLRLY